MLPNYERNPIKAKFATKEIKAEPIISQIVEEVQEEFVEKNDVHLSSYFSRLATSKGGTVDALLFLCEPCLIRVFVAVEAQSWITDYYSSLG